MSKAYYRVGRRKKRRENSAERNGLKQIFGGINVAERRRRKNNEIMKVYERKKITLKKLDRWALFYNRKRKEDDQRKKRNHLILFYKCYNIEKIQNFIESN